MKQKNMILDGAIAGLRGHAAAIDEGERLTWTTKTTEYYHHQRNATPTNEKETICKMWRNCLRSIIVVLSYRVCVCARTSSQKQLVRFEGLEGLSASWGVV